MSSRQSLPSDKKNKTRTAVLSYIAEHKSFTYENLLEEIRKKGDIGFILAPSYRIYDYLDNLVKNRDLSYDAVEKKYTKPEVAVNVR